MRILVTGTQGQVGSRVLETLNKHAISAFESDFLKPEDVRHEIRSKKPQLFINPAAYTAVDLAEKEQEAAFAINGAAVRVIGEECKKLNIPVIHFSTDYVYDGKKMDLYLESDLTCPLSIYGASKLQGENFLMDTQPDHWVLRTSWVFNAIGKNFLNTMLDLGRKRSELKVVNDQYGSPTSANFLARVVNEIVKDVEQTRGNFKRGIYHATCDGFVTWYGFATYIFKEASQLGEPLAVQTVHPIPSSEYPTPATRPMNSRLNNEKLQSVLSWQRPHWSAEVKETLKEVLRKT